MVLAVAYVHEIVTDGAIVSILWIFSFNSFKSLIIFVLHTSCQMLIKSDASTFIAPIGLVNWSLFFQRERYYNIR